MADLPVEERVVDVVVVGFGVAGISTAITAHDQGAYTVILEKMPPTKSGGSSRVSGLYWFSPTNVERAADYLRALCGEYALPEPLVTTWAKEMSENTSWLAGMGVESEIGPVEPEFPEIDGHDCEPGWFSMAEGAGDSRLWLFLKSEAEKRGIEVLYETRARELMQSGESREVVGVVAEQPRGSLRIRAQQGVVLASGGFANDPQLARDYLRLPSVHPRGSPASTGDGLRMAQKAGAGLWHMHNYCGAFGLKAPEFEAGFDIDMPNDAWIYVAEDGHRLTDESIEWRHGKIRVGDEFVLFPDRLIHCIFDESARLAGPLHRRVDKIRTSWNRLVESYSWSEDNSVEIERGWIAKAATLRDLAAQIGVDPAGLEDAVERYNAACEAGVDGDFRRDPATLAPIVQPPFYAWTWGPNVTYTNGGPMKDERARVLDPDGSPIPRLYAAGEVSSTYSWLNSGGTMIGEGMAFGRIAGRGVAAESRLN